MVTPNYPTVWYWVVQDTNPTTQVWESSSGAMVANTSANYYSWVANGGRSFQFTPQHPILAAVDNGAGLIRVTTDNTADFTTGDAWVIQNVVMNGATVINGTWPVTVINGTQLDLQGSTFVGGDSVATAGVIDRASIQPTMAAMLASIDNYNKTQQITFKYQQSLGLTGPLTLNNPTPSFLQFSFSSGAEQIFMPKATLFGSMPIGSTVRLQCAGGTAGIAVSIRAQDQTTVIGTVFPGNSVLLTLLDNSTQNGIWIQGKLYGQPISTIYGGLGVFNTQPTTGQIPIGTGTTDSFGVNTSAWQSISGDATLAANGALTLASPIVAGGPTGDASHVAQITYDAKGRLTAVTSIAITGTTPGGAAGGDLGGTYPNPNVIKVLGTATNDAAATGDVGEYLANYVLASTSRSATVTMTIASPCVVTWTGHPFFNNTKVCTAVFFTTTGALPTGITANTIYYAVAIDANTFHLATTPDNAIAGTFINTSGTQSGTHTGDVRVSPTSATMTVIAALQLTAGDWEAQGFAYYIGNPGVTTIDNVYLQISENNAQTEDFAEGAYGSQQYPTGYAPGASVFATVWTPMVRLSFSGTTTTYLWFRAQYAASTFNVMAGLRVRRVR